VPLPNVISICFIAVSSARRLPSAAGDSPAGAGEEVDEEVDTASVEAADAGAADDSSDSEASAAF
jgi:hypothetical protein